VEDGASYSEKGRMHGRMLADAFCNVCGAEIGMMQWQMSDKESECSHFQQRQRMVHGGGQVRNCLRIFYFSGICR